MRRLISAALAVLMLSFAAPALAANSTVAAMTAAGSVSGTDLFYCVPGGADRKCTGAQIAAFVYSLFSGDATAAAGGAVTFATVNANVGTFGSASQCTTVTVNAKGLITAASQAACTPAIANVTGLGTGVATFLATPSSANLLAALTTKTGTGNAVFGSAPTIDSLNAMTALTLAFITGSTQCLHVNTSGVISGTGSDCSGTIASGTSALGTSAISSATCATVVTTSAPGVATTDVVTAGFNGDPTAVTGYIPATAGMLTIISYPTSGNVNFKVCNNTGGSITPGAITLNWRVGR